MSRTDRPSKYRISSTSAWPGSIASSARRTAAADSALRTMPAGVVRSDESAAAVRRALDAIDPDHADVLLRRYFEGRTVREIAAALGESEKAVESRLHRAREALREKLVQGGDDEL